MQSLIGSIRKAGLCNASSDWMNNQVWVAYSRRSPGCVVQASQMLLHIESSVFFCFFFSNASHFSQFQHWKCNVLTPLFDLKTSYTYPGFVILMVSSTPRHCTGSVSSPNPCGRREHSGTGKIKDTSDTFSNTFSWLVFKLDEKSSNYCLEMQRSSHPFEFCNRILKFLISD